MKISRETLKPAHWLWIAVRSYGDVVSTVANIDPRGLRMDHLQTRIARL
jgi:hypothetical protein